MDPKIISLRYNQDQSCFSCAMESGVRIYNVDPLAEKCHYDIEQVGSISQCEMLLRSNLIAMVSGGPRPLHSDNILLIYDDIAKKFVLEISFPSSIRAVRLSKDKIVVALYTKIHVFSFPTPTQRLFSINSYRNPKGLVEISPKSSADKKLLFFPGYRMGTLQILDLGASEMGVSSTPVWISAHKGELACIAVNQLSTLIATASAQGTLIRVWDVATKNKLLELRRGADSATIYCLNFSENADYLCCSSDKGTVHIFAINDPSKNRSILSQKTNMFGKYMNSTWGFASFTVTPEVACLCAFTKATNACVAICVDGTFHKYIFTQGGSCVRDSFDEFLNVYNDDDV